MFSQFLKILTWFNALKEFIINNQLNIIYANQILSIRIIKF